MKRTLVLVLGLLVILGALVGCETGEGLPTPVPTLEVGVPEPLITPEADATPALPVPPRLLHQAPARGEEMALDGVLELVFDQPMDRDSVEHALRISPEVPGSIEWPAADTLRFVPEGAAWERDAVYSVMVDTTARAASEQELAREISFRFRTVGYLEVADVFPRPESENVGPESQITVIFNRPVVALTTIEEQRGLPQPLSLSPSVDGEGAWINTSIYQFTPSERLLAGTTYTATVDTGLQAAGAILAEGYEWSFVTEVPAVLVVEPLPGAHLVDPASAVELTFSQEMDRVSVQERFTLLTEAGDEVAGRVAWQESTLRFTPAEPLDRGAEYTIVLDAGARAAQGDAEIADEEVWQFMLAPLPQVVYTNPAQDATGVSTWESMRIRFSAPMDLASVQEALTITPTAQTHIFWQEDDTELWLSAALRPSTQYTITIPTEALDRFDTPLTEELVWQFETRPVDPSLVLATHGPVGVYLSQTDNTMAVRHVNITQVDFELYTLSPAQLVTLTRDGGWPDWDRYRLRPQDQIETWSERLDAELNQRRTLTTRLAPARREPLPSGIYVLRATAPEVRHPEHHILVVTPMNVTLKSAPEQALVWVTDLRDGQPMADVDVILYGAKGDEVERGRTDANGLLEMSPPEQWRWDSLIAIAYDGDDIGVAANQWTEGIEPWAYRLPVAWETQSYAGYFYTERRIYRPGQTVYFKGWLRADDDMDLSMPSTEEPVRVTMMDSFGRDVWQEELSLSDIGAVDGQILLGDDAPLGYHVLVFRYADEYWEASFQVAEYRRPEFQVAVRADRPEVISGEPLEVAVSAEFFFGGPVSEADVLWRVYGEPYFYEGYQGEGYYSFGDYDWEDREATLLDMGLLTEGRGRTDAQGRLNITVPTELQGYQSRRFLIETSVVDVDNQEITGRTSVVVHKGDLYVGLTATSYVGAANQPMTIGLLTLDAQGELATRQRVDVVVARQEWYSAQQRGSDGSFYWENQVRSSPVHTETVITDLRGLGELSFVPPEGGAYKVFATAEDEAGNEVRSSLLVWVSATGFVNWGQENHNRIELVPDQRSYAPGESALILIPSPFEGPVKALLTIERGGILSYHVIELQTNSDMLRLPILPGYAPNVFVSVVLVSGLGEDGRDPGYRVGYVMIPVSAEQHELQVSITPDRDGPYQPREEASFTIEVTDFQGRPVEAEVALQMVDLAIETLVGGEPPNIMDAFYSERGLAVNTALSLVRRRPPDMSGVDQDGKGGGGGEDGEGLRTEFPATALWDPIARTGPDGTVRVSVTLPDNLTTWRLTAQAVTAETQVGRGQADIVSNLEIMVRPTAPRFFVIDDEVLLGAVVHNNTDEDHTIEVQLDAIGLMIYRGQQSVQVPAGARQAVDWSVVVAPVDEVVLTYAAQGGGHHDATRITIPVYHATTPEVVGTAGIVEERAIEALRLPDSVQPNQGELTVVLEPSLAAAMREGLDYLEAFPYDCIEQTVSRFLPNVVTFNAVRELGIEQRELAVQLPQQVAIGLQRLYTLQGFDGGWGWWAHGDSSPLITAYALYGMAQARDAGFVVDARSIDHAVEYLYNWLDRTQPVTQDHFDTRAAVLHALAEVGRSDLGRTVALFEERGRLSLFAQAYLAMALHLLEPEEPVRIGTLQNELIDAALLSSTGMHWQEERHSPWQMSTDTRTTAMVLRALLWIEPEQRLLPQAVRWLTMARSTGRWETTQENVWAILALTDYMVATGELEADYAYSLTVDGTELASGQVTPTTLDQPVRTIVPMQELSPGDDSFILMERGPEDAPGRLYYSAFVRYYLPIEEIRALDRGITVYREYSLADRPDEPVTTVQVNDILDVKLTLIMPRDVYYLVVEDAFPAGCEALDPRLAITRRVEEIDSGLRPVMDEDWGNDGWWYSYWPTHTEMRDEKLVLFATELAHGTYEFRYQLRCTTPGVFRVIPALAYQMYEPDVFGRGPGMVLEIQR
jgi:alpha-2-macroglobulin